MGRDENGMTSTNAANNFNSHARVGRDVFTVTKVLPVQQISTHTPAWGATIF